MTRQEGAAPAAPEYPPDTLRQVPFRYAPGDGYVYLWQGGEHIEQAALAVDRDTGRVDHQLTGVKINVWDHEAGRPAIRRTGQAMAVAVDDWRYGHPPTP